MTKLVWLAPAGFSGGLLSLATKFLDRVKLPRNQVRFAQLTAGAYETKGKAKKKVVAKDFGRIGLDRFNKELALLNPEFIVINDAASLSFITSGKYTSLALCRGGIYMWGTVPCLVIDAVHKIKSMRHGNWVMLQDMMKLRRWIDGTQRPEPRFNYSVCATLQDVQTFSIAASNAEAIALDIETTGTTITCISYALWNRDGTIITYVVPFYSSIAEAGCFWATAADEAQVWNIIREVHASPVLKCMQNGSYDATYFTVYRCPVVNYVLDTLHLFHSIWPEAPKRLDFLASIALDFYRYWKDEGKEDEKEEVKGGAVPGTAQGMRNYWLYNALDSHSTLLICRWLMTVMGQPSLDWAQRNYHEEFTRQFGPAFAMSMRGARVNESIHHDLMTDAMHDYETANTDLMTMVGDPEFNVGSSYHVAKLLYDALKAEEIPRLGRTADEKALKLVATQHPLLEMVINQIWATKKPLNNYAKYSSGILLKGRIRYKLYTAGTPTGRFSAKANDLWVGTNIQNVPERMRVMIEADPGYVLVDADYAQSDAYFTAFTSEDKSFMETMLSGKDTHCVHAVQFFKVDYQELVDAHAEGLDWADHPTNGIRNITKRVVYGANYLMTGYTLFVTMGRTSVVAAAKFLGYTDADKWDFKTLVSLCDSFLAAYFEMYPGIKQTLRDDIIQAKANSNRATCAFGLTRVFFADLLNDKAAQREFAAYFGQGGTAGNINKALDTIFWELESQGVMLLFQVHDSIIFQVPQTKLPLIPVVLQAMRNVCEVKGRQFVVPVEAKVGRAWGKKRMISWHEGIALLDIDTADRKWRQSWADNHNQSVA